MRRPALAALALVALLAAPAPAAGAAEPGARAAATARCNDFRVVHDNLDVGLPAGTYHRLNFFQRSGQITCARSYSLVLAYLDERLPSGWTAGPLIGTLARYAGCRFTRNGTGGRVGFAFWCDGLSGSRGPCVRARNRYADECGTT